MTREFQVRSQVKYSHRKLHPMRKKIYQHRPQIAKTIFVLSKAPRPLPQSWSSPSPPNHRTLQWHHTTLAPCNGTQQWHHVHSTKVGRHPPPNHNTLQWHPTKVPSNGTTSTAPCNGTLQWHHVHSTIAHYNGTLQRHPAMAPRPFNHSTLQWHPAMAPCNGTTSTQP